MENPGNLAFMASKSGGREARNRGHRGHKVLKGRAFDASHIKQTENFADYRVVSAGADSKNSDVKVSEISFKPTSNGGRGGRKGLPADSLLKQLLEKRLAKRIADQNESNVADENNNGGMRDISFKLTSHGGLGGQKDSQEEKVAKKLALLDDSCPNSLEKLTDQNNDVGENARSSSVDTIRSNLSEKAFGKNGDSHQISRPAVDLISGAYSSKLPARNTLEKSDEFSCQNNRGVSMQREKKAEKLALLDDSHPNSPEKFADQNNNVPDEKSCDISLKPTLKGGRGGQNDPQVEKEAEKLALLGDSCTNSSEKSVVQNNNAGVNRNGIFRVTEEEKFRENNVEIFRKAFGDNHYLVNAGRQGLFSKYDGLAPAKYDSAVNGGKSNHPATVSSITGARNTSKKFDKFREIDTGNKKASERQPNWRDTYRFNSSDKDDAQFRENVEIFRKAFGDGHYLVKAKDDLERFRDNNVEIFRRASVTDSTNEAKRGHKGYFSKDVNRNEIFRKAFGDSHYFVKAGQEGCLSKALNGKTATISTIEREAKFREKGNEFAKVNRKGFSSKNYLQIAAGRARSSSRGGSNLFARSCRDKNLSPFVDSIFVASDKFPPGGVNQSQDLDQVRECENIGTNRSNLSDDAKFRENVEIFRRAFGNNHYFVKAGRRAFGESHYLITNSINEAKRGHEGFSSTDENHNKIMTSNHPSQVDGAGLVRDGGAVFAKESQKGLPSIDVFKENVEIFRRAFGESHYIVRAGHDFARVSHLGISSKGSSTQSGKFSEYVQKVDFATTRVPDEFLPLAVYAEKLDISNSKVAASITTTMPIMSSEESSKKNLEEIAEVSDVPEGAHSDPATTEMEVSVSTPAIPEELSKNNAVEIDKVTDSAVVTDAPQGAQGANTVNTSAVIAEVTKVAKANSTGKKEKGAYQTSLGSSIAKNRPKRACTLKRTTGAAKVKATKVAKAKSADKKGISDSSKQHSQK